MIGMISKRRRKVSKLYLTLLEEVCIHLWECDDIFEGDEGDILCGECLYCRIFKYLSNQEDSKYYNKVKDTETRFNNE